MNSNVKFYARRSDPFGDGIDVVGVIPSIGESPGALLQPTQVVARTRDTHYEPHPWVTLDRDSAQRLMDELWSVGLRPSEGTGSAGALAATERHLQDMRTIALQTLAALPPKIAFETQYRPAPPGI
jgi:hypothetical protein